MWAGPYKIFGKLPNGNLKLRVKGKPYIVHPNRLKPAEITFDFINADKKKSSSKKKVTFDEKVEIFDHESV